MYSEEGIILCLYNIVSFSKMLSKLGLLAGFMYTRCPAIAKGSSHRINIGVRKMPFFTNDNTYCSDIQSPTHMNNAEHLLNSFRSFSITFSLEFNL